ncbi:MAG: DUF4340 domain-containing protein [Kiritimatiellia bacterium]
MHLRTTFWLLVAVLFTGAFYLFVQMRDRAAGTIPAEGALLLDLDPAAAEVLKVETPAWRVECRKLKGRWRILVPLQGAADAAVIERILGELATLPREEVATPDQMRLRGLTLAQYGLETPSVRITTGTGSGPEVTILLGAPGPFPASMFVKRTDEPVVVTTRTNILAVLPAEAGVFRDRRLLEGDAASVVRFELERRAVGFVQLALENGDWRMLQPMAERADSGRVLELLRNLLALEVQEVLAPEQADPAALGLDPEGVEAAFTIWMAGESTGTRVEFGRSAGPAGGKVCARIGGAGTIMTVDTNVLSLLAVRAPDLRDKVRLRFNPAEIGTLTLESADRRLTARRDNGGWLLTEPLQAPADTERLQGLLTGLAGLTALYFEEGEEASSNGLPLVQVRFWTGDPTGATVAASAGLVLRVWGPAATGEVYRADTGTGSVFGADAALIRRALGPEPFWDPLRYRDRMMLALKAETLKRITLVRGAVEQRVEREEKGRWISHDGRQVREEAVNAMAEAAASLRALRLEAAGESDAPYGFDTPSARIEFGLAGADGIQKTVLIGLADPEGNRYARVQGQDPVFVISADTAGILMSDLLQ